MKSIITGNIRHNGKAIAVIKFHCDLPSAFASANGKIRISLPFMKGDDRNTYIRPDFYDQPEGLMRFDDLLSIDIESVCGPITYDELLSQLRVSGWDVKIVSDLVHGKNGVSKFVDNGKPAFCWSSIIQPDLGSISIGALLLFAWTFVSRAFLADEPVSLLNAAFDSSIVMIVFWLAMFVFYVLYWRFRGKHEPN